MKRKIRRFLDGSWQQFGFYLLIAVVVAGFLVWQLGTLVGGMSQAELAARANANSFTKLLNNPIFLPHKAIQYLFIRLGHDGAFWMRLASVFWGFVSALIFYDLINSWYNRRIAYIGGFLLLSSAWFLHFARLGTPDILLTLSVALVWVGIKLKSARSPRNRTIIASLLLVVCCLYVPGLVWLLAPAIYIERRLIKKELRKLSYPVLLVTLLASLVGLAPLVYGIARHPSLIRAWLYLPASFQPAHFVSNLWNLPFWLVYRGPAMPTYWLGHLPILDIFSIIMLSLGIFVLSYYRRLARVQVLTAIAVLALILAVLNGWIALLIALPAVFAIICSGVALLLQQWFTVFPRNPLARSVGLIMVIILIGLSGYYNYRHYFVAWPKNQQTRAAFRYDN